MHLSGSFFSTPLSPTTVSNSGTNKIQIVQIIHKINTTHYHKQTHINTHTPVAFVDHVGQVKKEAGAGNDS